MSSCQHIDGGPTGSVCNMVLEHRHRFFLSMFFHGLLIFNVDSEDAMDIGLCFKYTSVLLYIYLGGCLSMLFFYAQHVIETYLCTCMRVGVRVEKHILAGRA